MTDANLLLGRLDPDHFLGGRMALDLARTVTRAAAFAARLGITSTRLAEGIVAIANASMERAIRTVSVERGSDPRAFALLAFGGAGGMHACEIAEDLEIATVLVPEHAGVLSALGMLLADVRKDFVQTILRPASALSHAALEGYFAPLVERAAAELGDEGFRGPDAVLQRSLDMRYRGQSYEIKVPFTPAYEQSFHEQHRLLYGHGNPARATEIVNVRLDAFGTTKKHVFPSPEADPRPIVAPVYVRPVHFAGRLWDTQFFEREALLPGMEGNGPAIISGGQATVVITPAFNFRVDGVGTLIATRRAASGARSSEE